MERWPRSYSVVVPDDPRTEPAERRRRAIAAGHRGDESGARAALADEDPVVRAAGLGALARMGALGPDDLTAGLLDGADVVRRRAAEAAGGPGRSNPGIGGAALGRLRAALSDDDPLVAEAACWALGEAGDRAAVGPLAGVVSEHPDARCREAAVAALGAIGDPAGLAAVLGALGDKPTVRRRATVALAGFDGPEAEAGLRRSLADRDWQVRQVAEILLDAE